MGLLSPGFRFTAMQSITRGVSLISNAPSELPRKKPADVLSGVIDLEKSLVGFDKIKLNHEDQSAESYKCCRNV